MTVYFCRFQDLLVIVSSKCPHPTECGCTCMDEDHDIVEIIVTEELWILLGTVIDNNTVKKYELRIALK